MSCFVSASCYISEGVVGVFGSVCVVCVCVCVCLLQLGLQLVLVLVVEGCYPYPFLQLGLQLVLVLVVGCFAGSLSFLFGHCRICSGESKSLIPHSF